MGFIIIWVYSSLLFCSACVPARFGCLRVSREGGECMGRAPGVMCSPPAPGASASSASSCSPGAGTAAWAAAGTQAPSSKSRRTKATASEVPAAFSRGTRSAGAKGRERPGVGCLSSSRGRAPNLKTARSPPPLHGTPSYAGAATGAPAASPLDNNGKRTLPAQAYSLSPVSLRWCCSPRRTFTVGLPAWAMKRQYRQYIAAAPTASSLRPCSHATSS